MLGWGLLKFGRTVGVNATLCVMCMPVFAQSIAPSQLVPQRLAPASQRPPVQPLLEQRPELRAPSGAKDLVFSLRDIVVEGGFEPLQGTAEDLTAPLKAGKVTVDDVFEVRRRLEEAYARAGYVLVRVTVPPQKVEDGGTLRLRVVDGHIEAIDASALPESLRNLLEGRVKGLVGRKRVTLEEIERLILLAGDVPGVK